MHSQPAQAPVKATVRFSNFGGNPHVADADPGAAPYAIRAWPGPSTAGSSNWAPDQSLPFFPDDLPDGIEVQDPMLKDRTKSYAESLKRRQRRLRSPPALPPAAPPWCLC
ncbi:hypothetical protein ACFFN4_00010 [Massilia eurypsychrophila]